MRRVFFPAAAFLLSFWFIGCASENHDGLIQDVINLMAKATTEMGNINARVKDAIKATTEKQEPFDLKEAIEATTSLKETGASAQKLKGRIEPIRKEIADSDKEALAKKYKDRLTKAFRDLADQRDELRQTLKNAEKLGLAAKREVVKLRTKLTEAESPFEALARQ
ncbi:MAG: hypothetical protein HYX68_09530 [Planctomycetes bacterium]|nr:hypothetical protein [Planctomycetota bacterium]